MFVHTIFSLYDADEALTLMETAGFDRVEVETTSVPLRVAPPADFLWQYVRSTPIASSTRRADLIGVHPLLERGLAAGGNLAGGGTVGLRLRPRWQVLDRVAADVGVFGPGHSIEAVIGLLGPWRSRSSVDIRATTPCLAPL